MGAILEVVSKWHAAESLYEQVSKGNSPAQTPSYTHIRTHTHTHTQECARTPGFISMMRSSAGGAEKMQYLDYENYRHITFKWHFKLTKALVVLLESKDYMQVCVSIFLYSLSVYLSCNKTLLKLYSTRQDTCVYT